MRPTTPLLEIIEDYTSVLAAVFDLATIRARTLLVSGDRDPLYPLELAVELYQGILGAALCVVPEGGHLPIFGGEREAFERRALGWLGARR